MSSPAAAPQLRGLTPSRGTTTPIPTWTNAPISQKWKKNGGVLGAIWILLPLKIWAAKNLLSLNSTLPASLRLRSPTKNPLHFSNGMQHTCSCKGIGSCCLDLEETRSQAPACQTLHQNSKISSQEPDSLHSLVK